MKTQARNIVGTLALGISLLVSVPARSATWPNTFTTNSQAVMNGYVTPQMFGVVGDGVTDDTAAFQRCLNHAGWIFVPSAYYSVTNLFPTNNTRLTFGVGASLLFNPVATNFCVDTLNNTNIQIDSLFIDGGLRAIPASIGTRHGLNMNLGTNGQSWIRYSSFIGLNGMGIHGFEPGGVLTSQIYKVGSVDHCRSEFCGIGADQLEVGNDSCEYSQWSENQAVSCLVGVNKNAGNVQNLGWRITDCPTGVRLYSGNNGNHGVWGNPIFNHCTVALAATNFINGELFEGGFMLAGGQIIFDACAGIEFHGMQLSGTPPIMILNSPAGGYNLFEGCKFQGDWAICKQTITNDGGGIFFGNFCFNQGGVTNSSDGSFGNGKNVIKPSRYDLSTAQLNGGTFSAANAPGPYFDIGTISWSAGGAGGMAMELPANNISPCTNSILSVTVLNTNTATVTVTNVTREIMYFPPAGRAYVTSVIYNTLQFPQGYTTYTLTNFWTNTAVTRVVGSAFGQGDHVQNLYVTRVEEQPIQ